MLEWMAGKERLRREELRQGGTCVQEGAARDIDLEGGEANGFCGYGRKGDQKEYRGRQITL